MGHRPCGHPNAEVFRHLRQEDGQDPENNKDHVHISGWAERGLSLWAGSAIHLGFYGV